MNNLQYKKFNSFNFNNFFLFLILIVCTSPAVSAESSSAWAHAYNTNCANSTVSVIELPNNNVTSTVPVGTEPKGVAVTPEGAKADSGLLEKNRALDIQTSAVSQNNSSSKLESYLMSGEKRGFSENNLKNVLSNASPEEFDFSEEGNVLMSTAYPARLSGPVNESDDPYSNSSVYSPNEFGLIQNSTTNVSFSSKYDLRTLNKLTSVKDQGNAGTCWAFATYGSLESYLMPGEKWDFSENNLKNVLSNASPEGFDFSEGGNAFMSTAYLARWSGPVNESDDPYSNSSVYSPNELVLPVYKHVQDVYFLPSRQGPLDNNEIKYAIEKYGAVKTGLYVPISFNNFYSNATHSFCCNISSDSNHAVDIIGWDDLYNKNNFTNVPPGNGALIVKDSFGTVFDENGHFYVSYYDSNIGKENSIFTAESKDNYNNIYQYDPLGWTNSVGCRNNTYWGANVFTANSNETLKAVSFYTTGPNSKYQIHIYNNLTSGPISKTSVLTQRGTSSTAGYHTVKLNTGIPLKTGQKFSVVLKLTTSNCNYPIPVEVPMVGYSSKAKANSSESFVSCDGDKWSDITSKVSNTNVCIKAFTDTQSRSENNKNS